MKLALTVIATIAASQSSANDLNTCAAIQTQAERLACYDKLAGRQPQPALSSATVQPTPAQSPPAPQSPASTGALRPATPLPSVATPDPIPAASARPAPGTEAFGLYEAEHPAAPKSGIEAVTGKVVDLKYDAYGKETIWLEGGAIWQLAGSDAVLAKGDEVTIRRATLGSYLMRTSAGREHRVKRLR